MFSDVILYFWTAVLVIANSLSIYLFHQINISGIVLGKILLPVYFFTLIAGGRFGWKCGLIVGILTPLVSNITSGMPIVPILYFVLFKSAALGVLSGLIIHRVAKCSYGIMLKTIIVYQVLGMGFIALFTNSSALIFIDVIKGWPGLIIQLLFGTYLIKRLQGYEKEVV